MKNLSLFTALSLAILISSCKKNDDMAPQVLEVQSHDQNEMMKVVHAMIDSMHMMKMTGDPDYDFAMMMKGHHKGAINMANLELSKGTSIQIKSLAQKIKDAQASEMTMLDMHLKAHPPMPQIADTAHLNMEMRMSMKKMEQAKDLKNITGNTDNDFAALIIPHHQSAIEMAQTEVEHGKNAELKEMAKKMIMDQTEEIIEFQEFLLKNNPTKGHTM